MQCRNGGEMTYEDDDYAWYGDGDYAVYKCTCSEKRHYLELPN